MGSLIEQRKQELERRKNDAWKVEQLAIIMKHIVGIFYALAILYLGYKPDLRK